MALVYIVNGVRIRSPKKIYKVDGVLCHRKGEFYEPVSPSLLFKIEMARMVEGQIKNAQDQNN